jgi:hypothetical protein
MNQSNVVETLSSIPVVFAINKKRFWILKSEQIDKI